MKISGINQHNLPRMKSMFSFLQQLARHNNREWFQEHKAEYTTFREVFEFMTQELIDRIALFDPSVSGLQAKDCIFRIYRDTRFSYDKTPYKTHFGAWITKGGRKSDHPGYYLHVEPGNCLLAAGVWHPDTKLLKMIRKDIYENIDEFLEIIQNPVFEDAFHGIQGSSLRRVPTGYPADFPHAHLLMLKDYFVEYPLRDDFFDENWVERAGAILEKAYPYNVFLGNVVREFEEQRQ